MSVVLPQPDSPAMPTMTPSGIVRCTPSTAFTWPRLVVYVGHDVVETDHATPRLSAKNSL